MGIAEERKEKSKRHSEAATHRAIDMYGTDDFFRIDEMEKVEIWPLGS